jgi:hypothetical protein
MRIVSGSVVALFMACAGVVACGGSQSPPQAPAETEAAPAPATETSPTEGAPSRPELTAEACEANGGTIVGDIGDGAIHRADYRCPSGAAPSGDIKAPEGGPMGVEGSVCCAK